MDIKQKMKNALGEEGEEFFRYSHGQLKKDPEAGKVINNSKSDRIQYRSITVKRINSSYTELSSKNRDAAPSVRLVGATYWDSSKKPGITGAKVTGYSKDLEVPEESQFEEPASIAPLI